MPKRLRTTPNRDVHEQLDIPDRIECFFRDTFLYIPTDVLDIVFHQYLVAHIKGRWEELKGEEANDAYQNSSLRNFTWTARYTAASDLAGCLGDGLDVGNIRLLNSIGERILPAETGLAFSRSLRRRLTYGDFYFTSAHSKNNMWLQHRNLVITPEGAQPGEGFIAGLNKHAIFKGNFRRPRMQLAVVHALDKPVTSIFGPPTVTVRIHLQSHLDMPLCDSALNLFFGIHSQRSELGWLCHGETKGVLNWVVVAFQLDKGCIKNTRLVRSTQLRLIGCKGREWPVPGLTAIESCSSVNVDKLVCRFNDNTEAFYHDGTLLVTSHYIFYQYDWSGELLRRLPWTVPHGPRFDLLSASSYLSVLWEAVHSTHNSRSCIVMVHCIDYWSHGKPLIKTAQRLF